MPLCFCIAGELSKLETRVQEDGRVRLLPSFLNSGMTECVVKEELAPHAFPLIGIKFPEKPKTSFSSATAGGIIQ